MKCSSESIRQLKGNSVTLSVRRAIRRGLRRLRETGDRLTGGGLRSLGKRRLRRLRDAGDRLTGGGLRASGKRVLTASLRRAMSQPALKALACGVLQPFSCSSQRLYRLATPSQSPAQVKD